MRQKHSSLRTPAKWENSCHADNGEIPVSGTKQREFQCSQQKDIKDVYE